MTKFDSWIVNISTLALVVLFAATAPFFLSLYHTNVAMQAAFATIGAYSLWLIMRLNLISIGNAAFAGVGAYVTAILCVKFGWPFWATIPFAGLVATVFAVAFGLITLRLQGIYFAMMSFVFLEIFQGLLRQMAWLTGGESGLAGVPRPEGFELLGITFAFNTTSGLYYLALIVACIVTTLAVLATRSRFGLVMKSIASSEKLAESAGISVFKYRLLVLGASSFFLGICGSLMVASTRLASPSSFGMATSVDWLVYAALGARLGRFGPLIVAVALVALTQIVFTQIGVYRLILYGLILILTVMIPEGAGSRMLSRFPGSARAQEEYGSERLA